MAGRTLNVAQLDFPYHAAIHLAIQVQSEAKQSAQLSVDAQGGLVPAVNTKLKELSNSLLPSRCSDTSHRLLHVPSFRLSKNAAAEKDDVCRSTAIAVATKCSACHTHTLRECAIWAVYSRLCDASYIATG